METSWLYPLLSLLLFIITVKLSSKARKTKLPPSPPSAFPFLGHLRLLKPPQHRTYHDLSQKAGSHLLAPAWDPPRGRRLLPTIVDECFTKNDVVLANRPRFLDGKYIGYNYSSLAAAPYGDYWRNLRRITTVEILSSSRLNSFHFIRHDEVRLMLKKLCRNSDQEFSAVAMRPLLSELTFNNIMRMVAGKRYFGPDKDDDEAAEFRVIINEAFTYGGVSNPGDFWPVFRWIDYKGIQKRMAELFSRMDAFLQGLLDEQRRGKGGNTMIDHLFSLQESEPEYYTDAVIKALIMVMLLAGTDTSSVTIEWAMASLLNHPEKLQKARDELDNVVGSDRLVDESDVPNLPYLQSIISETFRLYPAAPLLLPHQASADIKLAGYDIPRGTILVVNAWAVHRDPTVWDDPMSFNPERFESREYGPSKLLPFGMGRRACPAAGLAQRIVGLALGSLIQCFEWERVDQGLVDLMEGKEIHA